MAEKDYIEREAAIAVIYGQHVGGKEACENARPNTYGADLREIVADIEEIPAADVRPVVVCCDCKHFQVNVSPSGYLPQGVPEWECRYWCRPTDPTDFCSYGEKREES